MTKVRQTVPAGRTAGIILVLALVAVAMAPYVSQAQDRSVQALVDRIDRLERDIRTLNMQISRGGSAPLPAPSSAAGGAMDSADLSIPAATRLNDRISALESDLRALTGRNEEMAHRIDTVERRLDTVVSDLEFRLSTLEKSSVPGAMSGSVPTTETSAGLQPVPPAFPPPPGGAGTLGTIPQADLQNLRALQGAEGAASSPTTTAPAAQMASRTASPQGATADEQYAYARSFLFKHEYGEAEKALSQFLAAHPNHALAGNARYWLGETYYVRQDNVRAAEVFLDAYQKDPKGSKAPDTLLKLGMSLTNLEKSPEACAAFNKLRAEFPDLSQNIRDIATRERERAHCS